MPRRMRAASGCQFYPDINSISTVYDIYIYIIWQCVSLQEKSEKSEGGMFDFDDLEESWTLHLATGRDMMQRGHYPLVN